MKKKSGLTLVEVLFVILIMSVVMGAAFLAFRGSFDAWQAGNRRSELIQTARVGLNKIVREIRQAQSFDDAESKKLSYTDKEGYDKTFEISDTLEFDDEILVDPIVGDDSSFTYYKDDGNPATTLSEIRSVLVTLVISDSDDKIGNMIFTSRVRYRR